MPKNQTDLLPKDGAWARFGVTSDEDGQLGKYAVSLVGTLVENGELCRWLEVAEWGDSDDDQNIKKMLIPERELLEGDQFARNSIRAWCGVVDGKEDRKVFGVEEVDLSYGEGIEFYTLLFPGPRRGASPISERRLISCQKGVFEVLNVLACDQVLSEPIPMFPLKRTKRSIIWPHSDIPFGIVAARIVYTNIWNGLFDHFERSGVVEYVLEDAGYDAMSKLPDIN